MTAVLTRLALLVGILLAPGATASGSDISQLSVTGANVGAPLSESQCLAIFASEDAVDAGFVCENFRFERLRDVTARADDIDRVAVTARSSAMMDACQVAALIRDTEAIMRLRFFEVRFSKVTIKGTLILDDLDSTARLIFEDVNFVQPRGTDCGHQPIDPAFEDASIIFGQSRFRERVTLERALIEGDVVSLGSTFEHTLDIAASDIGGDLVFEDVNFAGNLRFGRGTILRGQLVVHGVRIGGNLDFDGIEFIDTYLNPLRFETRLPEGAAWDDLAGLSAACVCSEHESDARIDRSDLAPALRAASDGEVRRACQALPNLPRCPRSNGSQPTLIEISSVDVAGAFRVANLLLGSPEAKFHAYKSSDARFRCELRANTESACGRGSQPVPDPKVAAPRYESTMSRLRSAEVVVYDVTVSGTAAFLNNHSERLYINHSQLQRVRSEGNIFAGVVASRNKIGSFMSLRDAFLSSVVVTSNDIARSLQFDSTKFLPVEVLGRLPSPPEPHGCGRWPVQTAAENPREIFVDLSNNFVGRDLTVTPYCLTPGWVKTLNLSSNRVAGNLSVNFPVTEVDADPWTSPEPPMRLAWHGTLALNSVDVIGAITLNLSNLNVQQQRAVVDAYWKLDRAAMECVPPNGFRSTVHVELRNAETNDLVWALPVAPTRGTNIPCVSWAGVGFRYDTWQLKGKSAETDATPTDTDPTPTDTMARDFRAWGELYAPPAEQPIPPDPLHYIADYMSDLGNQRASLQVRAEAKKADFPLPWARCWSELGSELGSEPFRPDACATVLGNLGARFIFLPTDFGTKPENALIILIGATTLAWCIYRYCRRDWRPKWPDLREDRDRLAKRQRLEGDMQQHLATSALARAVHDGRRPDLSDVGHAPFIFADDTMASSVEERIDEAALRKHLDAILDRYAPAPRTSALTPGELMHLSEVPGFMQYDRNRQPQNFDLIRYAVDVSIPVVDLHAYSQYYPVTGWVRGATVVQHLIGWWVLTSFLASLAAF